MARVIDKNCWSMLIPYILCMFLQGCFTIPSEDKIYTIQSSLPITPTCVRPLPKPITIITCTQRDQSFRSKINYLNDCMINYSWGRGCTDKKDFNNQ